MDTPDFTVLSGKTMFAAKDWADAWTITSSEFPQHQLRDAWEAVRALSKVMVVPPDDAARALVRLHTDFAL